MKYLKVLCLVLLLFAVQGCGTISQHAQIAAVEKEGWELTFHDEFDGTDTPDPDKWDIPEYNRRNNPDGPDGWWRKENAYLDGDGHLIISVEKVDNLNDDGDAFDYATGAVRSIDRFEQRFGRFDIRCRLPEQPGWWAAFWLYSESVGRVDTTLAADKGGEDGTEIDIMEGFGWTDMIHNTLHWDGYGRYHKAEGKSDMIDGVRDGYHIFTLEWDENEYRFYADGVETWRSDAGGVSKVPAYVKITGELSTEDWSIREGLANDPAKAEYPDYYIIDWVRVYRRK